MPHVNLYVRQEDWEAFEAIKNKPEWLHLSIEFQKELDQIKKEGSISKNGVVITHAVQPLQVNPKSHGPEVEQPHYESIDDLP